MGLTGATSLKEVLAVLEQEANRRQRSLFLARLYTGLCYLALVLVIALSFIWGRELNVALLVVVFGGCGSVIGFTKRHFDALLQATSFSDPSVAPHLLDALDTENAGIKNECRQALERLLPTVTPAHGPQFLARHRAGLVRLVKELDLQLAQPALAALSQVGDSAAAEELEAWAARRSSGPPKEHRLKALALQSAGDLRMRLAREIISRSAGSADPQTEDERSLQV